MLSLSSSTAAAQALRGARTATFVAYTLRRGAIFDALEAAARGGARVSVQLEVAPFGDADGSFARANAATVAALRGAGVDARLSAPGDAPIHAKELQVDGALYLDDRNWGAGDVVLRDDDPADPAIATRKRAALASEAAMLRGAVDAGEAPIVESESFGCCNAVYAAVDALAKRGLAPRVLVCERELRGNARERAMLERLAKDGAQVRVTAATDKLALAGENVWIGSANATAAIALPDTIDWGVTTNAPDVVGAVRARAQANWERAKPLPAEPEQRLRVAGSCGEDVIRGRLEDLGECFEGAGYERGFVALAAHRDGGEIRAIGL
jgi:hypothetical protein